MCVACVAFGNCKFKSTSKSHHAPRRSATASQPRKRQQPKGDLQPMARKLVGKLNCFLQATRDLHHTWPRGVTVSTLDSESSDRGSNPREAFWLATKDSFVVFVRSWYRFQQVLECRHIDWADIFQEAINMLRVEQKYITLSSFGQNQKQRQRLYSHGVLILSDWNYMSANKK